MAFVKPCLWAQRRFVFLPPVSINSSGDVNQLRPLLHGKYTICSPQGKLCSQNRARNGNTDLLKIIIVNAKLNVVQISCFEAFCQMETFQQSQAHMCTEGFLQGWQGDTLALPPHQPCRELCCVPNPTAPGAQLKSSCTTLSLLLLQSTFLFLF